MVVDVVIKNCKIVTPKDVVTAGVAVNEGKIVSVAKDSLLPKANRTIDAGGNYILPGIIDQHVHLGAYHPLKDDIKDTGAAACGGVTTIGNSVGILATTCTDSYKPKLKEWIQTYNKYALVDAIFHVHIISDAHIKEIVDYARDFGVTSYKFVPTYRGPDGEKLFGVPVAATDGDLWLGFKAVREALEYGYSARAMVHCENIDVINKLRQKLMEKKPDATDLATWMDSRPKFVEALDIERVVSIAKITNTPIYIVHLSSDVGVDAVAKAKAEGVNIVAETCPSYLTLTKDAPIGTYGKVMPALKDKESVMRLWQGLRDGTIECIGTDHCTTMKDMKEGSIWTAAPGFSGVETLLPIMLSEGVNKGRITLEKLVEVCCYNNARYFGIYPKKGSISIGSDADLVIVDLNKKVKITSDKLHWISDFCIFEGWEVKGWPMLTMVRGNIVMEDGNIVSKPGSGKYIPRKKK